MAKVRGPKIREPGLGAYPTGEQEWAGSWGSGKAPLSAAQSGAQRQQEAGGWWAG